MAARNNKILLTPYPQGRRLEGIVYGTPKPGTVMSIKSPFYQGGWHQWEPYSGASGERGLIAVLLEDEGQGKLVTEAYVTGTPCFLYCPIPGDELNMLLADVSGTGDTHLVLEKLRVETATGKLIISASSPEAEPFMLLEAQATALSADVLAPCIFTGY